VAVLTASSLESALAPTPSGRRGYAQLSDRDRLIIHRTASVHAQRHGRASCGANAARLVVVEERRVLDVARDRATLPLWRPQNRLFVIRIKQMWTRRFAWSTAPRKSFAIPIASPTSDTESTADLRHALRSRHLRSRRTRRHQLFALFHR
jgi:hypothetical protein